MNKKIALLIGGEFRTFFSCLPAWKNLSNLQIDFFISTWSKTYIYSDRYDSYDENFTKDDNPNFYSTVDSANIKTLLGDQLKFLNLEEEIKFEHRGNKQIYHWHKLLCNLINVADNYDYAIITRPDLEVIFHDKSFLQKVDTNKIYGSSALVVSEPPIPFVLNIHDVFFMSNPKKLIEVLLPVPYMKIKSEDEIALGRGDNFHHHLAYYFANNNIYIYSTPAKFSILRSKK